MEFKQTLKNMYIKDNKKSPMSCGSAVPRRSISHCPAASSVFHTDGRPVHTLQKSVLRRVPFPGRVSDDGGYPGR